MITLKDLAMLNPSCKIGIGNCTNYNIFDIVAHPERYAITDMGIRDNELKVLVKAMGDDSDVIFETPRGCLFVGSKV